MAKDNNTDVMEILLRKMKTLEDRVKQLEGELGNHKKALREHNVALVHLKKKGKKINSI